jgi:DHA2 family multidrug resistance protein
MVRNLGGAIGIAVASQIVVERGKLHAMRLGESIVPYSDACQERLIGIVRTISGVYVDRKHVLLESGLRIRVRLRSRLSIIWSSAKQD